eukprot:TRINITY_DN4032_c0_g1_i1.p1 TRINITY_DN4032_c0_g1~~TRINITY_DN4032_c0_g1_i1.p1  ORF type:complete len:206 (-),score=49.51 TRINITY_DN4032_c0_g1_i1:341-916(-)
MNKQIADLLQLDDNLAEKDYQARFKEIADVLLNSCDLVVQPSDESDAVVFQLAEIEFYVRGDSHDDVFTHGDPFQKEFLQWYFHRSGPGKAYKEGSYRGFDLALGTPDMFCGVLVRSLRRVDDGSVVQGSCLSLNAILDALSFQFSSRAGRSSHQRRQPVCGVDRRQNIRCDLCCAINRALSHSTVQCASV